MPALQDPSRPLPVYTGKLETGTNEDQGVCQAADLPFVLHDTSKKVILFPLQAGILCWMWH